MFEKIILIKEILELIHHYRKKISIFLLIGLSTIIAFFSWIAKIDTEEKTKALKIWNNLEKGDSLFVRNYVYYLDFYKKGKQELLEYEQKEIFYKREDTLNFIKQNSVHEKFFYQNKSSYIGICLGKDSTVTKEGESNNHRWVKIKPRYEITHPPKSDKYDYEARKWEDNITSYFVIGKLSKEFYVSFNDIIAINNDSIFNK